MQFRNSILLAALMAAALSTTASAAIVASAMTPLNVRSGPGPQYPVIGAIPLNGKATIIGC
ncbi:MAG: SH3 domain-containing protein, partial [Pseudolabrys sp.]